MTSERKTSSGRVISPDNVLDTRGVFEASPNKAPLNQQSGAYTNAYYGEPEQRVTIWNRVEQRKLSGNSAPFRKNLGEYIRKHPEWELYAGQDKEGYVPGANLVPPQRAPSRQSPTSAVPRERESRRVAALQIRERERQQRREQQLSAVQEELAGIRSPTGRSPRPHPPPRAKPLLQEPEDKPPPKMVAGYRPAVGRESETALRLRDVEMPLVVPSNAEVAAARSKEMLARRQSLGGETEEEQKASNPAEQERKQWDEQWKAAEVKVNEARAKAQAARVAAAAELSQKRKAEQEEVQASAIELCSARIERFKRSRKGTAA